MGRLPRSVIGIASLVIVAGAMSVFCVIALVSIFNAEVNKGRRGACLAILAQMEQALTTYRLDQGAYPPSLASLNDGKNPKGRIYFDYTVNGESRPICDPWDRPFAYRIPANAPATNPGFRPKLGIEFYSVGPNGIDEGGSGDDITGGH